MFTIFKAQLNLLQVGDSDTESEEAVRPNRLETITISIDDRKFVTASRTMMCIPGSYFWLIMNPGGDPGPKFEHDADILELGPGPGTTINIEKEVRCLVGSYSLSFQKGDHRVIDHL